MSDTQDQGGYADPSTGKAISRNQSSGDDTGPDYDPRQGGVAGYGDTPSGDQDGSQGGTSAQDPSQQDPNAASYDQSQYGTNQDQGSSGGYDAEQQGGYDVNQSGGDQDQ